MDEDQILQSIIADPQLTDPSIDVGQLRQTTPTRAELLADVPEFSGLKFDPTQRSYVEDLYALYGGGAPMLPEPVVDTPVVTTPVVDTSVMDQPASDSILDTTPTVTTPTITTPTVTEPVGGGADMGTVPATEQVGGITGDPIDVGIPDNESGFVDPLGTMGGALVVGDFSEPTTILGPLSQVQVPGVTQADLTQAEIDAERLANYDTPEQQEGFLQNVLGRAGQTVEGALNELSRVPGAVVDFANQTVDVFGQKLNVGKTLASVAINKIVGGPISLVFDAIGALPSGISETTNKAREVGLLQGDSTVTQDKYGINTQSMFGDYNQYNLDRVDQLEDKVNKTPRDIQELKERKDYIDSTGAAGDITPDATPTDVAAGNLTGDATIAETIAQQDKNEIQPTDPSLDIPDRGRGDDGGQDKGPSGPPSGPGEASADAGFADTGFSGDVTSASAPPGRGGGSGGPPSQGGGSPGGGKVVCTMMNESYGFGSFRNKIWLRQSKDLAPEYQIGYHKIFLPLVKLSKTNKILKKILEHIAVHRTIDIRQESRGKVHLLGRLYRKILEPICYWTGKYAKR